MVILVGHIEFHYRALDLDNGSATLLGEEIERIMDRFRKDPPKNIDGI
jgi:hypothetical protein